MVQHSDPLPKLPSYFGEKHISIEALDAICSKTTNLEDFPFAAVVEHKILIYEGGTFRQTLDDPEKEAALKIELCRGLNDGPGVFVVKDAYPDTKVIDRSTAIFGEIVAEERAAGLGKGDHFGKNERIWNTIQRAAGGSSKGS